MTVYTIKLLRVFAGETAATLVWSKPTNATEELIYEYALYETTTDPGAGNYTWVAMGKGDDLKLLNIGDSLWDNLIYRLTDIDLDKQYTIRIRAIEEGEVSIDDGIKEEFIISEFVDDEPNPSRCMRGLDAKFNLDSSGNLYKVFYNIAIHIRDFYADLKNKALNQLNILTATDEFVDNWGFLFNVARQTNETDKEYAARIVRTFLIEKCTPKGIIEAIQPYSSIPVVIVEGAQNFSNFIFDNSYFDFDPYNPAFAEDFSSESVSGQPQTILYYLNDLYGTNEYAFGNTFGGQGVDIFLFIIKLNPIPTGDPASIENTIQIVANIIQTYKIAGTQYLIEVSE